jgi:hypothetical protein
MHYILYIEGKEIEGIPFKLHLLEKKKRKHKFLLECFQK